MGQHEHIRGNLKTQSIAVGVGFILLIIKLVAWMITGSNAILSDAAESVVNVVAGAFALFSIHYASQPKDPEHLYGHGKMEFISSGMEGMLIFVTGMAIIGKAIYNLVEPNEIQELGVGIVLSTAAGLVNFLLAALLIRRGRKTHSTAMEADGQHLLSDAYSTVGMLIGLLVVWFTGKVWLDNAIALVFGVLLIRIGYKVIQQAVAGILDRTDETLVRQLVEVLSNNRSDDWIDFHNLRIIKFGSVLHVDCHLTIPWYYDIERGHQMIEEVDEVVNREMDQRVELFIHVDPCRPKSCPVCPKVDCEVRKHAFLGRSQWTLLKVLGEERHTKQDVGA